MDVSLVRFVSLRRFALIGGVSASALGVAIAAPAAAQCAPDPTVVNGTTTCSGVDPDGLRVTTSGTTVQVASGAAVRASTRPALAIELAAQASATSNTVTVAGTVAATGQPGLALYNGTFRAGTTGFLSSSNLALTVAAGGSISGTNAVLLTQSAGNTAAGAFASIDNSGTLSGSGGIALLAGTPTTSAFTTITNRTGGTIGAILGPIGTLANAGVIDGGTRSAVDYGTTFNNFITQGPWTNTGTIRSSSDAATVVRSVSYGVLSNSGTISNLGNGAAIRGDTNYTVNNLAGGVISARNTAIVANALTLSNAGTIRGNIVATPAPGASFGSTIDSTLGTIIGNVTLGETNDVVVARYVGTPTLVTGITGTIDPGQGTNAIQLGFAQDATINTAVALPSGFQRLRLSIGSGATVTLGAGFAPPAPIELTGSGALVNRATIVTTGQVFTAPLPSTNQLASFVNAGTIRTTAADGFFYGISLGGVRSFTNTGTIDLIGRGIAQSNGATFTNSGSITATDIALSLSQESLNNSGVIRSTGGVGVDLSGNVGIVATNSGRIEGKTFGVTDFGITFVNSGTIVATGTAFGSSGYTALVNTKDGVITGGTRAFGTSGFGTYNSYVVNAGIINGDVLLSNTDSRTFNTYVAQTGGVLNGNLVLGAGDVLITDLVNTGRGAFAGINGTVSATNSELRYRVAGTVATTLAPVGPFQQIGYDLVAGAALTVTSPTARTLPLTLSGVGTVDFNATILTTNAPVLQTTALTIPGITGTATSLAITSRGTLSYTRASSSDGLAAVLLGSKDSFTNAGTLNVSDATAQLTPSTVGIIGGASVVNTGTINLRNAIGVGGNGIYTAGSAAALVNSGTIAQTGGSVASIGVSGVGSVTNSGSISVQGIAIVSPTTVVNSGSIVSTGGIAITSDYAADITNSAGGTIRGGAGQFAIRTGYGTLTNAGTITGNVDLGYAPYGTLSGPGATYVAAGGTLAGTLQFGTTDDTLLVTGASAGVSGTIDGGTGLDTVVLDRAGGGAGSFAGATNFERLTVNAGSWTLSGTQTYANGVSIASGASANLTTAATFGGDIVNNGTLTSALAATLSPAATSLSITNAGTIANTNATGRAINIAGTNNVRDIVITNAAGGLITSADDAVRVDFNPTVSRIRLDNAGTIQTTNGGQAIDFAASTSLQVAIVINNTATGVIKSFGQDAIRPGQGAIVTNAGLIFSDGPANNSYDAIDWQASTGTVFNQATGTISGLRHGITSDVNVTVTNAGLIVGRNGSGISSDGNGTVVNTGTITGQWDGVATNADGDGINIQSIVRITNSGVIQGLSAHGLDSSGRPNSAEGIVIGGGQIVNTAGALVFGAGNAILANPGGVPNGMSLVNNSGTIRAGSGYAIEFVGDYGGVIINSGTIIGGAAGAIVMGAANNTLLLHAGSVIIGTVDGGAGTDDVILSGTGSGSFAGAMNFESLQVYTGDWTLTAPSTFADGTSITAGASLTGNSATLTGRIETLTSKIVPAGALIFNQFTDGTFTGTLSGGGQLIKNGAGALTIGNQGGFTGATQVNAGRLVLAGALPSAVSVANGATLAGNGTVASLALAAGSTVAPGNSPGTIVVTGNFTQAAGATYAAEVAAGGVSDRIVVGGTATLSNGALLSVTRDGSALTIGQRYTLLTAAGGIVGTYTLVQSPSGGTEFRLVQSATGIAVDLARTGASLATVAQSRNQAAVAGSFGTLGIANRAYAALTLNPDDSAVRSALDGLSGEVHASLRTGMLKDAQAGADAVRSRIVSRAIGNGVWGQVNGLFGTDAATRDAAAVNRRGWGIFGGADVAIGAHARAGIAGGYTRSTFGIDERASRGTIKTKQVLAYAGGTLGPIAVRASVGYAWSDDRTTRSVSFLDYAATHSAAYNGNTLHGRFEAGITRALRGGTIEPYAGIEAYRVHSDAFAETGAATTALVGQAKSETFTLSNLGLRADTPIVNGVSARTQLGWRHVLGDARPNATLQFSGAALPFTVSGAGLARDSATMALDLEWKPVDRLSIIAGYSGAIGGNGADDNRLRLTASLGF